MSDSLKKEIIEENDYSKYLEQLKTYYNLKKKYTSNIQTYINKLINSNDSIENKKKLYNKFKPKCINCGNIGGTIFRENNNVLNAMCGNTHHPCDLNIEIIKYKPILIHDELHNINILLITKKKQIILTKLDFLFNYIPEDKAIEIFENLKSDISNLQDKYNDLFSLYNSITSNTDNKMLLNEKLNEHQALTNDYKEFIKIYKNTNDISYIKDAVNLYINKIKTLDEFILNIKYKYNNVEFNEECKYLIQNKYNLNNLELIKLPN